MPTGAQGSASSLPLVDHHPHHNTHHAPNNPIGESEANTTPQATSSAYAFRNITSLTPPPPKLTAVRPRSIPDPRMCVHLTATLLLLVCYAPIRDDELHYPRSARRRGGADRSHGIADGIDGKVSHPLNSVLGLVGRESTAISDQTRPSRLRRGKEWCCAVTSGGGFVERVLHMHVHTGICNVIPICVVFEVWLRARDDIFCTPTLAVLCLRFLQPSGITMTAQADNKHCEIARAMDEYLGAYVIYQTIYTCFLERVRQSEGKWSECIVDSNAKPIH